MICTKEVYDNLLKFYHDNKSRLKELGERRRFPAVYVFIEKYRMA